MGVYNFQRALIDALIEKAFVRDVACQTPAQAWIRFGNRIRSAAKQLLESDAPVLPFVSSGAEEAMDEDSTSEEEEEENSHGNSHATPDQSAQTANNTPPPPRRLTPFDPLPLPNLLDLRPPAKTLPSDPQNSTQGAEESLARLSLEPSSTRTKKPAPAPAPAPTPPPPQIRPRPSSPSPPNSPIANSPPHKSSPASTPSSSCSSSSHATPTREQSPVEHRSSVPPLAASESGRESTIPPLASSPRLSNKGTADDQCAQPDDEDKENNSADQMIEDAAFGECEEEDSQAEEENMYGVKATAGGNRAQLKGKGKAKAQPKSNRPAKPAGSQKPAKPPPPSPKKPRRPFKRGHSTSVESVATTSKQPPARPKKPLTKKGRQEPPLLAAFPTHPLICSDLVVPLSDLLEESVEQVDDSPGTPMDTDSPSLGPRQVMAIKAPVAVYDEATGDIKFEEQAWDFPYRAQVWLVLKHMNVPDRLFFHPQHSWTLQGIHYQKTIR
jgi:hypothetical protein